MKKVKSWIEAIRPRTLPASVSGVVTACGYALLFDTFKWLPALLCLIFAVLCQIVSNFANEYYDFKAGLDRKGREGPRRGVTEGDISPRAMKIATYATLVLASVIGLSLTMWGGLWLVAVGVVIALGALAYSTGPYPLSHHALGEVAVLVFFGIIPVNFTFYVMSGYFDFDVLMGSVSIGLMGANILIVNNYRDRDDDMAVGKNTIAVKFGSRFASNLYLVNGYVAVALMVPVWFVLPVYCWGTPLLYLVVHTLLWDKITKLDGAALNIYLGITAMLMLLYAIAYAASAAIAPSWCYYTII